MASNLDATNGVPLATYQRDASDGVLPKYELQQSVGLN